MSRITKLQNQIGQLQTVLAEKNRLIAGFKAEAEQLIKSAEVAVNNLREAKDVAERAGKMLKNLKVS